MSNITKPIYRGTMVELEAASENAKAWFKAQIWERLDEADRKEITDHGWIGFDQRIERRAGYPGIAWSSRARRAAAGSDFFFVWRIMRPYDYKSVRLVVRKDGTLNAEALMDVVSGKLNSRRRKREESDILERNKEIWAGIFDFAPGKSGDPENLKISVSLSSTAIGECTAEIPVWEWGFSAKKKIKIEKLRDFEAWAAATKEALERVVS